MKISIEEAGENSCVLHSETNSSTNAFPIPISATALVDGLKQLLRNSEKRDHRVGTVYLARQRDWVAVHSGPGRFELPHANVYPIVLA